MSSELTQVNQSPSLRLPPVPWRDPHAVSPAELAATIQALEKSCQENPKSADLRTCLGMAHAMNYDVYQSLDSFETAITLEPENFWAQMKYAELHYRLRTLNKAEAECVKALNLAQNHAELAVARRQLQTIRELMRNGTQKPEWTKSLVKPMAVLMAMTAAVLILGYFR